MPSLNLIPKLSFEPRFRMFIINDHDRKEHAFTPWIPCLMTLNTNEGRKLKEK